VGSEQEIRRKYGIPDYMSFDDWCRVRCGEASSLESIAESKRDTAKWIRDDVRQAKEELRGPTSD